MPTRSDAVALLEEWVESEALRKHMYGVEAAVRHYARIMGEDEDLWGLAGLLHDLDWERHPDEHPHVGVARLRDLGYPEEIVHAVLTHGYPERSDEPPRRRWNVSSMRATNSAASYTPAAWSAPTESTT